MAKFDTEDFPYRMLAASIIHQAIWDQTYGTRPQVKLPFWRSAGFERLCSFCGVEEEHVLRAVAQDKYPPFAIADRASVIPAQRQSSDAFTTEAPFARHFALETHHLQESLTIQKIVNKRC